MLLYHCRLPTGPALTVSAAAVIVVVMCVVALSLQKANAKASLEGFFLKRQGSTSKLNDQKIISDIGDKPSESVKSQDGIQLVPKQGIDTTHHTARHE